MKNMVVITGVSRGIGRALVDSFIDIGYSVAGCARDVDEIDFLRNKYGDEHLFEVTDVVDNSSVGKFAKHVYEKFGHVDILINNAATKSKLLPLWEVAEDDFNKTINTNIIGVVNMIRAFIPKMVTNQKGLIINFSSEWGRVSDPKVGSYIASKYAIEGLTKSLARDLPDGMIAIALSPLIVYTELLEYVKGLLLPGEYEMGVTPKEWADYAVSFLLNLKNTDNGKSITLSPKHTEIRD